MERIVDASGDQKGARKWIQQMEGNEGASRTGRDLIDLQQTTVRELNQYFHRKDLPAGAQIEVLHPNGQHHLAVGVDAPVKINIRGHAGYFIGGMNKQAEITVHGNVGWSVAENMMSGVVRVKGHASECAGATAHGGLLVIEGTASSRCGISLKGANIVVGGSVGHMSAFMAQAGTMVVCGDAGKGLGDSLYEAVIYVRGKIAGFGADARQEPLADDDIKHVRELLNLAGIDADPGSFKRVASAKKLYHWSPDSRKVMS